MTPNKILEAAERVVLARKALAEAEAAAEALLAGLSGKPAAAGRIPTKPQAPHGTVADAVRAALKGRGPRTFHQVVQAAGGNQVAVRSALKKERQRGHVLFQGGYYSWSVPKHDVKARPLVADNRRAQAGGNGTLARLPGGEAGGGKARRPRVAKNPGGVGGAGAANQKPGQQP